MLTEGLPPFSTGWQVCLSPLCAPAYQTVLGAQSALFRPATLVGSLSSRARTSQALNSFHVGADVMKRIAAPMRGGMITSTLFTLLLIPVVYSL